MAQAGLLLAAAVGRAAAFTSSAPRYTDRSCCRSCTRPATGSPLAAGAELLEVIGRDVLKLREELARFGPFAVLAECDVADHGLERVAVDVGSELVIIGALGFFHRLGEHLAGSIAERHEPVAERIDALTRRLGLVALEQIGDAGELKRRSAT